jgi:cytosine/adenosine deaminase-related metal-dependent hydrolase
LAESSLGKSRVGRVNGRDEDASKIATFNGAKATGFGDEVGALVPGVKGDAILVDLDRVSRDPWIDPEFDIAEAFVERAMGADVATIVIGEKIVVEDRQPRTTAHIPVITASDEPFAPERLAA